ncbi:hypothetical protein CGLAU_08560 [Corynebacterium glaucum]|uniref:DUF3043 domain-containing protein n=1 Tax=Corynebacterium glaucum TaxID=187491 RepID=A0A1Q2HXS4_9CORY|nr:DUF3043 domain-containing protein [Corynebacterium glaucum]AQQ15667.1 hypothetical protein CGLAU_08560 [Corynebacterium glaucum]
MKLPWQKSEQTTGGSTKVELPEPPAEEPKKLPKGYTPPKGKPTPKRVDQEIKRGVVRDPNAMTPAQRDQHNKELKKSMSKEEWKAYKKEQREANRAQTRQIQAKMDAGDERYLMDRDKGEVRRYVRDWVDSQRFFNNYVMPMALVLLVILLLGTWLPRVSQVLSLVTMAFMLTIFIEGFIIGSRVNRAVKAKFPDTADTGFGLGMYAFSRASQPRNWRSPKPRVAIGAEV